MCCYLRCILLHLDEHILTAMDVLIATQADVAELSSHRTSGMVKPCLFLTTSIYQKALSGGRQCFAVESDKCDKGAASLVDTRVPLWRSHLGTAVHKLIVLEILIADSKESTEQFCAQPFLNAGVDVDVFYPDHKHEVSIVQP